jgi:uncharacterized protein YgiM (DUF1202 family)
LDDGGTSGGGSETVYQYKVLADSLFVRSTPDNADNSNVIGRLKYDDIVIVDMRDGDWLHVAGYGWISLAWVIPCGDEIPYNGGGSDPVIGDNVYQVMYGSGKLNVRTGPGKQYDLVYQLSEGERVNVIKSENGWAQLGDGNWCYGEYLEKLEPTTPELTLEARVERLENMARENGWDI